MERNNPLIVIDAGHGGYDNGAQWNGRLEKDDNLRLSLAVRDALERQGVRTLMTRDTDVFIPLADRARIANEAGADLFIAVHRNSYIEPTPTTNGLENYIYTTAPEETAGRAAQLVLDAVVGVAAQSDRGVSRGNYYVLRRTNMPSMLLEMGFIINDEDNRLFDEFLEPYAEAIARGAMEYFGLQYRQPDSAITPPVGTLPPGGAGRPELVANAQQALNNSFGANLVVDGIYGPATKRAAVRAMQGEINDSLGTTVAVDGVYGPQTQAYLPVLRPGDRGGAVRLLQILLSLNGYDPSGIDGIYGPRTATAVSLYQRDYFLAPDGIAGPLTLDYLLA